VFIIYKSKDYPSILFTIDNAFTIDTSKCIKSLYSRKILIENVIYSKHVIAQQSTNLSWLNIVWSNLSKELSSPPDKTWMSWHD